MAEHERASLPETTDEAIAKALHTLPATVRDVAYGEGVQFSAGRGALRLEIYPRSGVARLTGALPVPPFWLALEIIIAVNLHKSPYGVFS